MALWLANLEASSIAALKVVLGIIYRYFKTTAYVIS